MATIFETLFGHAMDALKRVEAETATLYRADGTASQTIYAIYNEQVGFVDDRRRAVWTFKAVDVTVALAADRGDYFVLSGDTVRWTIVDVRDDKAGGIEVRADGALERL